MQLRDIIIFLAGAQAFHTLSHILFPLFLSFPVEVKYFNFKFTRNANIVAVLINLAITVALIIWAANLTPTFTI